jgi:hypothetical protein
MDTNVSSYNNPQAPAFQLTQQNVINQVFIWIIIRGNVCIHISIKDLG